MRLGKLSMCAVHHLFMKFLFDRRDKAFKLTAFSANFLVYDLSPGYVLRMESLFEHNPFVEELLSPVCFEELLTKLSKGCCFGMSISYILHQLHASRAFINSTAYGVPLLAQQIQLFCESPAVRAIFSSELKILATDKLNTRLQKLHLRAGRIKGPQKVNSFTGFTVGEGTHLIFWTSSDLNASGHTSVIVIEKDELTLYEPNIGELRGPRNSLIDMFRIISEAFEAFAHFEYFSLCTVSKTEAKDYLTLHDVLRFGDI